MKKVIDIIRPEDSRFETFGGIDFDLKLKGADMVKTLFWVSMAVVLTSHLSKLI